MEWLVFIRGGLSVLGTTWSHRLTAQQGSRRITGKKCILFLMGWQLNRVLVIGLASMSNYENNHWNTNTNLLNYAIQPTRHGTSQ